MARVQRATGRVGRDEDREVIEIRPGRALWATLKTLVFTLMWEAVEGF